MKVKLIHRVKRRELILDELEYRENKSLYSMFDFVCNLTGGEANQGPGEVQEEKEVELSENEPSTRNTRSKKKTTRKTYGDG